MKREDSFDPQENADRINYNIVNDDRLEKTLLQSGRNEQRLDNRCVVPDVERAPENLWNHWRERREQEAVTFAGPGHFRGSVHG